MATLGESRWGWRWVLKYQGCTPPVLMGSTVCLQALVPLWYTLWKGVETSTFNVNSLWQKELLFVSQLASLFPFIAYWSFNEPDLPGPIGPDASVILMHLTLSPLRTGAVHSNLVITNQRVEPVFLLFLAVTLPSSVTYPQHSACDLLQWLDCGDACLTFSSMWLHWFLSCS